MSRSSHSASISRPGRCAGAPTTKIDRFDGRVYRRALRVGNRTIALSVTQSGSVDIPHLAVKVSDGCADQHAQAIARDALDRLLGLSIDLSGFAVLAACDPVVDLLARELRGVKPPRFPTVFEALINAVACQQLSLAVGIHLLNRLTANHGRPVPGDPGRVDPIGALASARPAPQILARPTVRPTSVAALGPRRGQYRYRRLLLCR